MLCKFLKSLFGKPKKKVEYVPGVLLTINFFTMEKFLKVPVTDEQTQLIPATGVLIVEQASTTTVTIQYRDGVIATLTHATAGS